MVEPDSTPPVEIETAELFHQADGAKAIQFERTERRIIGNILDDLEQAGYLPLRAADGTPILLVVPACAVGAIHRRDRVWVIAYTDRERQQQQLRTFPESRRRAKYCRQAANPHPDSTRRQKLNVPTESARQRLNTGLLDFSPAEWQPHNTSELIQAAYGLPGRVARRSAQIRAYGNAIHPGVAYQIFQAIQSTAP
jgi:DNA (cytosine-5)-methyltransferase 1